MRFMACRIDASLQERYCKRNDSFFTRCVRDWSGILLERSGKRYSGKPDAKRNAQKDTKTPSHRDAKFLSC